MPDKTIYILGAGFSKAAGLPTQADLLARVLGASDSGLICEFITKIYGLTGEAAKNLALEDVYTPIHQSVARHEWLKGYSPQDLWDLERSLTKGIANALNIDIGEFDSPESFLYKFVTHLINRATPGGSDTVISLNWDIVLDRRLFLTLMQDTGRTDEEGNCVVDYCCQCTGLGNEDDRILPGILAMKLKRPRIKLIKVHGSLNWLTCRQCHRLYVNKTEKIGRTEFSQPHTCRHCKKAALGEPKLSASILLPTFQKDMNERHIQQIWNQAALDLSEAAKVVFIGYSFPFADFDFRALITKHLPARTAVEAVLYTSDETNGIGDRYTDYFGPHRCSVRYDGVEAYVESLTAQHAPTP